MPISDRNSRTIIRWFEISIKLIHQKSESNEFSSLWIRYVLIIMKILWNSNFVTDRTRKTPFHFKTEMGAYQKKSFSKVQILHVVFDHFHQHPKNVTYIEMSDMLLDFQCNINWWSLAETVTLVKLSGQSIINFLCVKPIYLESALWHVTLL